MNELKQGIYLQHVVTKIGTGVTSSNREVKNYYILRPTAKGAEAFLLTDNLELTGLRELLPLSELGDFHYQADLHERFASLVPRPGPRPGRLPPAGSRAGNNRAGCRRRYPGRFRGASRPAQGQKKNPLVGVHPCGGRQTPGQLTKPAGECFARAVERFLLGG